MALSPYGNVAAVTDTLGRVLLVDTSRGTIKRMWKGYRNAQVRHINSTISIHERCVSYNMDCCNAHDMLNFVLLLPLILCNMAGLKTSGIRITCLC